MTEILQKGLKLLVIHPSVMLLLANNIKKFLHGEEVGLMYEKPTSKKTQHFLIGHIFI